MQTVYQLYQNNIMQYYFRLLVRLVCTIVQRWNRTGRPQQLQRPAIILQISIRSGKKNSALESLRGELSDVALPLSKMIIAVQNTSKSKAAAIVLSTHQEQHKPPSPRTQQPRDIRPIRDQFWNSHDEPHSMTPLTSPSTHFWQIFGNQSSRRGG